MYGVMVESEAVLSFALYTESCMDRALLNMYSEVGCATTCHSLTMLFQALRVLGIDSLNVFSDHAVPVAHLIVYGVAILRRLLASAGESVTVLPEQIRSNACGVQGSFLPRVLNCAVVVTAILLEQTGLASRCACSTMSGHPQVTPAVRLAPLKLLN